MHVEITKSNFKTVHFIKTWTIQPHKEHKNTKAKKEKKKKERDEEERDMEET